MKALAVGLAIAASAGSAPPPSRHPDLADGALAHRAGMRRFTPVTGFWGLSRSTPPTRRATSCTSTSSWRPATVRTRCTY